MIAQICTDFLERGGTTGLRGFALIFLEMRNPVIAQICTDFLERRNHVIAQSCADFFGEEEPLDCTDLH